MTRRFKKNELSVHRMVSPQERNIIIQNIDSGNYLLINHNTKVWWENKHHPKQVIPTNLYLLGNGRLCELFEKYNDKHEPISRSDFNDYTRELIKQGIMLQ